MWQQMKKIADEKNIFSLTKSKQPAMLVKLTFDMMIPLHNNFDKTKFFRRFLM